MSSIPWGTSSNWLEHDTCNVGVMGSNPMSSTSPTTLQGVQNSGDGLPFMGLYASGRSSDVDQHVGSNPTDSTTKKPFIPY